MRRVHPAMSGLVRHHDDRDAALLVERGDHPHDLDAGRRVEIARRLVGEQHLRLRDDARAMATRCCWPPDSWLGTCDSRPCSPTSCSALRARMTFVGGQVPIDQRQLDVERGRGSAG